MHCAGRHWMAIAAVALLASVSGCTGTGVDSVGTDLCDGSTASPSVVDPAARPIAFTSDRSGSFDLWLMGSDGSDPVPLTSSPHADAMPAWSPDGERLAFVSAVDQASRGDICVINADGTGLHNLTRTADVFESAPAWSPDGAQIAYGTLRDGNDQIHLMDSDASGTRVIASDANWPSWSPDGERIVFSSNRARTDQKLWVMNRDGSGQVVLAEGEGSLSEPSWSPDGQSIAFISASGSPDSADPVKWNEDILVMAADGGPGRRVTTLPGNDHWPPAWSPDSSKLAFTADGTENVGEILVVDLTTLATTNLTDSDAQDAFPAWRH